MRKLGFTLAEVLITLGIIGVIATLTLPSLMSNTAEREYSTAFKKAVSQLTEAVQMQVALENISFDEMIDSTYDTEVNSLYAFLCNRMQTEKFVSSADSTEACATGYDSNAKGANCLAYGGLASGNSAMFFRDGSAIMFKKNKTIKEDTCKVGDDTFYCFKAVYDVNGVKKPNVMANCKGTDGKAATTSDITASKGTYDCTAKNFNARDQYPIKLYEIGAYPNSAAAHYIMDKK